MKLDRKEIKMIEELLRLKREGKEKDSLPQDFDTGAIEELITKLFNRIDIAYMKSFLEQPTEEDWKEMDKFLIKTRKRYIDT